MPARFKKGMGEKSLAVTVVMGTVGLLLVSSVSAHSGCQTLAEETRMAVAAGDLKVLRRLHGDAGQETSCDSGFRAALGRAVALGLAREAQRQIDNAAPPRIIEALLVEALSYGRPWSLLALWGDRYRLRRDYVAAATFYRDALLALGAELPPGATPPPETAERLAGLARETRLLAGVSYRPPSLRCGGTGHDEARIAALTECRGRMPLPIQFERDKVTFTAAGQQVAEELRETLAELGDPPIRIIGHTDQFGVPELNRTLSQRRAEAVRRFLITRGYEATIVVEGKGADMPLRLIGSYSKSEINSLNRRVEWSRLDDRPDEPGSPPATPLPRPTSAATLNQDNTP